jgi:NADH dehydrogenase/NADH:ubiquinone oxidoreductase subunit G
VSEAPKNPKVSIDGVEVEVSPGSTIIQAAQKIGKVIPHFCYHPGLPVVGQCRMCFVEIEGAPKLATACSMPVADGMKVKTDSPKVQAGQNGTLEFTLLNHPLDCPICDRGGECKLQDYTYEYGPPLSRMTDEKVLRDKHKPISEQIVLDQERCILCTRCTRFSADVDGRTELVVNERGSHNHIDVFEGRPLQSKFSGNVVDLCPVGALTAKDFRFAARPWELRKFEAICTGCAVGCNIEVHTKHRHPGIARPDNKIPNPEIERLVPRENAQVNTWWMCDKGRWGYHFNNNDAARLHQPLLKRSSAAPATDAHLREIQSALEAVAKDATWTFLVDDTFPHEGISWAKELAASWSSRGRKVNALNHLGFADEFLKYWASRSVSSWFAGSAEWSGIKAVVAPVEIRALEDVAPILALRLGQEFRKGKLEWVVAKSFDSLATERKKLVEKFGAESVATLALPPKQKQDIKALEAIEASAKLLFLFRSANARGLLNEGLVPLEILESSLSAESPKGPVFFFTQTTQNALSPQVASFVSKANFLVVADSFRSELTDKANIVLPLVPLYETPATFTNLENRRQKSAGVNISHPNIEDLARGGALVNPSLRLL